MLDTVKRWVPLVYDAFMQHRLGSAHLSAGALAVVKRLIAGEKVTQEESGLSKREWAELKEKLGKEK
jgi:thymidylate synthase (FAD)